MGPINWENPTPRDEARFAAAVLEGKPIERCRGVVTLKGNVPGQCRSIGRWKSKRIVYTKEWRNNDRKRYSTVAYFYCTKHAPCNQLEDVISGQKASRQHQKREIARATPDWR